MPKYMIDLF